MPFYTFYEFMCINQLFMIFYQREIDDNRRVFEEAGRLLYFVCESLINDVHVTGVELERHEGVHSTFQFDSDIARHNLLRFEVL